MATTTANTPAPKLTGFRLNPTTLARLKTRAKTEKISLNALVDNILTEEVKDIKSEEEILEAKKRTQEFLDSCWGAWAGPEYDDIEDMVLNHKHSKPIEK